jgi:predicted NAD/FAD-binding protein
VTSTGRDGTAETEVFDEVVFATHADQTLSMLTDVTVEERRVLSAFPYQTNDAVLHTDTSLLPRRTRAWASWNYTIPHDDQEAVSVTYDLSRLQNHDSPSPILLTLNRTTDIDPSKVLRRIQYMHPAYCLDSISAQREHDRISGTNRTHFCGAYWGYGFHEDGVNSALAVARHFGLSLDSCTAASTKDASRIAATVL